MNLCKKGKKRGDIWTVIFDPTYRIVLDKIISETLFPKSAQMMQDRKQPKQLTPTHSSKWSSSKISFENCDTFPEGKLTPLPAPPSLSLLHCAKNTGAPSQPCECLSPHQSMSTCEVIYYRVQNLASCLAHSILFVCFFFFYLIYFDDVG